MTTINSNLNVRLAPWIGHAFQIRWSSTQARLDSAGEAALHRRCFVLHIELLSDDQAAVAAWIESARGHESILDRHTASASTMFEHGLLHVDVFERESNVRMASLSIVPQQSLESGTLLYARTELLAKAGFAAGSCDPPVLERSPRQSVAASA